MSGQGGESEQGIRDELARTRAKLEELQTRLEEPEEIVRAIRGGEVDAFVVTDPKGDRIYSLRSADVLFRSMVEQMKEGALALEPSGLIVYANRYFADLMKVEPAALLGGSLFAFVAEESRGFFDALGPDAGSEPSRAEIVMRSADGLPLPAHATMNRIDLEGGPVFCLIVTDLTAERRREQLVAESRQKDEFLAMLAHELRNPIAPIRSASEVIERVGSSEPRVRWAQGVIHRQVTQLSRLVDDLLDISRITRGKIRLELEAVDLQQVVARGIETARPAIEGRAQRLDVDLPSGQLRVDGDLTRLSQVVSNILHNAAKFTPEGGRIWIGLEQLGAEGRIVVRDSGSGIRPEMLSKIFDLFTQVDSTLERAQGGLGIGLALVRNLVELHRGRVEAQSDGPGRGSTFTVSLPLLAAGANDAAPAQRAAAVPAARSSSRRILVVDDNVDAAESLTLLLGELGHEVKMLTEGSAVLETARTFRPHLILLDISLPDVSGFDLAAALRRSVDNRGVCLVALTGYGHEDHRRRSRDVGFDHHWVKPIDLAAIDGLLRSLASRPDDLGSRAPSPDRAASPRPPTGAR
jgi:PAS domain S-box-containing protein